MDKLFNFDHMAIDIVGATKTIGAPVNLFDTLIDDYNGLFGKRTLLKFKGNDNVYKSLYAHTPKRRKNMFGDATVILVSVPTNDGMLVYIKGSSATKQPVDQVYMLSDIKCDTMNIVDFYNTEIVDFALIMHGIPLGTYKDSDDPLLGWKLKLKKLNNKMSSLFK